MSSLFYKCREFFQLRTAHCRLHIRCLQVISEMGVHILVVIAQGKFPVLFIKTVSAHIIPTGRTHAVSSPVSQGSNRFMDQWIVGIDSSAFSHRHMMWWIETGSSHITDGSCKLFFSIDGVFRPQCITVVLYQPQSMLITKFSNRTQIPWISQRMSDHNRLGLIGKRFFQHRGIHVILRNGHIHKYWHRAVLNNRCNRGRKSGCHGDHFISRHNPTISHQRGGEGHKCQKVGRRT